MQEIFEKIKERLEERKGKVFVDGKLMYQEDCFIDIDEAIEIVNQVAEEYSNLEIPNMSDGKDTNVRRNDELLIHVMHGYDSLEAPNGEMCFGCYVKGKYEIYVADDIPKEQFFQTIAHEYIHYLQDIEGKDFSEEEADSFATDINVGSNDGWIPCSERLPEIDGKYIVCTTKGSVYCTKYHSRGKCFGTDMNTHIEAWQPLPEPYKPKGEK